MKLLDSQKLSQIKVVPGEYTAGVTTGKRKHEDNNHETVSSKRAKRVRGDYQEDEKDEETAAVNLKEKTKPFDSFSINLWDEKYVKDPSPLVRNEFRCSFPIFDPVLLETRLPMPCLPIPHASLYSPSLEGFEQSLDLFGSFPLRCVCSSSSTYERTAL